MSDKNTPISIYGKNKKLKKVIFYRVDGVRYRETISLDTANGDFGKSLSIEEEYIMNIMAPRPIYNWRSVKDKDVLSTIQDDTDRITNYSNFLKKLKKEEGANKAFEESGLSDITNFDSILAVGHNIPLPPIPVDNDNPKDSTEGIKIEPKDILGDYKDIFKKHLKYPIDMFIGRGFGFEDGLSRGVPTIGGDNGSQDYMFIEQFMYQPPQPSVGRYKEFTGDEKQQRADRLEYEKGLMGTILQQGISRGRNTFGNPMGSCILPIPNRLGVSQGVSWGEARANAVELGAFQAVTNATRGLFGPNSNPDGGGRLLKLLADGGEQAISTFNTVSDQLGKNNGTANAGAVLNATIAKSILGRIGINVDTQQFLTRETGAAINPNLELLFAGPQLRTFSFVFNFAPNSTQEAKVVRMIHRWFRQGMLASKTTDFNNGGSLFLGSPNVFRLCYKNNNRRIKSLNTFKICALTSVQIDFTPDGVYQSYEDKGAISQPVRSTMKVDFSELTPIFMNDYNLNDEEEEQDPSIDDLGLNVTGDNKFTEDDLGF
tara:strand:- start:686 stop:2317 length:1632 start_codon:yes stop_codon:yes gene_type:complete